MLLKYLCTYCVCFYLISAGVRAQNIFTSFNDKHIAYEGRVLFKKDAAELSWPGMSITINFMGSDLSGVFKDQDTANYYNIIIDNKTIRKFHTDTAKKSYLLASGLPYGKHTVQIFKRTEWDKGKTWFYGLERSGKTQLLSPPKPPKRRMEVFGNSITCGYGIEDLTGDSYVGYYENCYDAYAALTARHFNAQCHYTAKSGIGITISWFPLIMSQMYDRTDPVDSTSKWDFKKYTPDLVLINLFQNDSWLVKKPDHEEFKRQFGTTPPSEEFLIESYRKFVKTIRATYPKAQIICMLGNMDITRVGSPWPGYVEKAVAPLHDKKLFTFFVPYKNTSGHPKTSEQKALADSLIRFIEQHIKW